MTAGGGSTSPCGGADTVEVRAYAKVNLTLEVLGRRPDGYHEVTTVLQTVNLSDTLRLSPASDLEVECSDASIPEVGNLVTRAAEALRRATGCDKGARIEVEKCIPLAAGLGGGSSDAAATLRALNGMWGLDLGEERLAELAALLGSDVPFFLCGGTAQGSGRGELIAGVTSLPTCWMVILCPDFGGEGVSADQAGKTARLYDALRPEHFTDGARTRELVSSLERGGPADRVRYNVFDRVAPTAFPGLDEYRREFEQAGAEGVILCGAGPGLFTVAHSRKRAEEIRETLKLRGLQSYCVTSMQPEPHE